MRLKTEHRKDIKKISTAILRGKKIAEENDIEVDVGVIIQVDDENNIYKACAMGLAYIGKFGIESAKLLDGESKLSGECMENFLNGNTPSECIRKIYTSNIEYPQDYVIKLNDVNYCSPEEIAKKLKNCKL